jgi:hypothetical protein
MLGDPIHFEFFIDDQGRQAVTFQKIQKDGIQPSKLKLVKDE